MRVIKIKVDVNSIVPIVDNEISNDISSDWNYERGEIIVCGILYGNTLTQYVYEKDDDIDEFKNELAKFLDTLPTMYAFNFLMEKGNFKGFFGAADAFFQDPNETLSPLEGGDFEKDVNLDHVKTQVFESGMVQSRYAIRS